MRQCASGSSFPHVNPPTMEYFFGLALFFLVTVIVWLLKSNQASSTKNEELHRQLQDCLIEKASLQQENKHLREKLAFQQEEQEKLNTRHALQFEQLASRILEEKSRKFSIQNQENLERILNPLGKELASFKAKVEETYDKESKERFSLEKKVRELAELNLRISEEAKNLTNALKGNAKVRGNWGEAILETILQNSGLERDRHYEIQGFLKDDSGNFVLGPDGKKMQPDVIINYPDQRKVIIDSKVSLIAYERHYTAEDTLSQEGALKDHLRAIRLHIDQLSSKQYEAYAKVLDFVIMFVPMEAAYITAVQADPNLWEYAYKKRVLLISSSNLIAALKLIRDLWVKDDQTKHALDIATRGGLLYDKFVSFLHSLEDIGKNLQRSSESYEQAMKQISSGKGNLISQAEKLRRLGVPTKNRIPDKHLSSSEQTDGSE